MWFPAPAQGRSEDASRVYLDAQQIDSDALGPDSERLSRNQYELALLDKREGEPAEAEALLRSALAIDLKLARAWLHAELE